MRSFQPQWKTSFLAPQQLKSRLEPSKPTYKTTCEQVKYILFIFRDRSLIPMFALYLHTL